MHDYLLPDGPRKKRLAEISGDTSLDGEIRAARLVAEEMLATGSPAAQAVLATIGRLAERSQAMSIKRHDLISAQQLSRLMFFVGDTLMAALRSHVTEELALRIADDFQARFTKAFAEFQAAGQLPALTDQTHKERHR
jgi:hypothetical protein